MPIKELKVKVRVANKEPIELKWPIMIAMPRKGDLFDCAPDYGGVIEEISWGIAYNPGTGRVVDIFINIYLSTHEHKQIL